jgi:hypothetical protein
MKATNFVDNMTFGCEKELCAITPGSNGGFQMRIEFVDWDPIQVMSCSTSGVVFGCECGGGR